MKLDCDQYGCAGAPFSCVETFPYNCNPSRTIAASPGVIVTQGAASAAETASRPAKPIAKATPPIRSHFESGDNANNFAVHQDTDLRGSTISQPEPSSSFQQLDVMYPFLIPLPDDFGSAKKQWSVSRL